MGRTSCKGPRDSETVLRVGPGRIQVGRGDRAGFAANGQHVSPRLPVPRRPGSHEPPTKQHGRPDRFGYHGVLRRGLDLVDGVPEDGPAREGLSIEELDRLARKVVEVA